MIFVRIHTYIESVWFMSACTNSEIGCLLKGERYVHASPRHGI